MNRNLLANIAVGLSVLGVICSFATWGFKARASSQCQVRVGFGQTTMAQQCYSDQVMVGHSFVGEQQYLLCAKISVECP